MELWIHELNLLIAWYQTISYFTNTRKARSSAVQWSCTPPTICCANFCTVFQNIIHQIKNLKDSSDNPAQTLLTLCTHISTDILFYFCFSEVFVCLLTLCLKSNSIKSYSSEYYFIFLQCWKHGGYCGDVDKVKPVWVWNHSLRWCPVCWQPLCRSLGCYRASGQWDRQGPLYCGVKGQTLHPQANSTLKTLEINGVPDGTESTQNMFRVL